MPDTARPTITVCIANYNGLDVIDACLQSILGQTINLPLEIIIHDDASTDRSAAHIRTCYPQVRLIESCENVGFCIANNRMAEAAQGEYLLLLNNDAALFPDALATLHASALAVGESAILGLPQFDAASGSLVDRGSLFDPFLNPIPNLDSKRTEVAMVIGACLWLPRRLWFELDGFPPWFHSLAEDMYLCCRARLAGHPVRSLPNSGYIHWQGKSFGGNRVENNRLATTFRRRSLSERNKTFVMTMTYPLPLLIAVLPIHLLALTAEGVVLTLLKRDRRLFREIYWASMRGLWHERHRLRSIRKRIQATRITSLATWLTAFRLKPHKLSLLIRHGLPSIR